MRLLVLACALATGCVDYSKLSSAKNLDDSTKDLGDDLAGVTPLSDLASADLTGVDLAGLDFAQVPTADLATTDAAGPPPLPASCRDINDANPASNDGNFTLYYNRDVAKPWVAWCKGMGPGGNPVEYLTLPQGAASNTSIVGADLQAWGEYAKIRLDPVTLKANPSDATFNLITGAQSYGCTIADKTGTQDYPYAYAYKYCGSNQGTALIDLRGTPFAVAQGAFTFVGDGAATYSNADQTVSLTATTAGSKAYAVSLQLIYP